MMATRKGVVMMVTERYQKLKDAGLCTKCGKPSLQGRIRCQRCLDYDNKWNKDRYSQRVAKGLCRCGKPLLGVSGKRCKHCILTATADHHLSAKRWRELLELYKSQKGICPYTGVLLKLGENASLDHIVPRAKGGSNNIGNLQWIHRWANGAKSDYSEAEFRNFIVMAYNNLP